MTPALNGARFSIDGTEAHIAIAPCGPSPKLWRGITSRPAIRARPVPWTTGRRRSSTTTRVRTMAIDQLTAKRLIDEIAKEVAAEVLRAEAKHMPLNSPHEAWSVIYEELEELREHVRGDTGRSAEARKEAIQVAAMGLRYVLNLCEAPK